MTQVQEQDIEYCVEDLMRIIYDMRNRLNAIDLMRKDLTDDIDDASERARQVYKITTPQAKRRRLGRK